MKTLRLILLLTLLSATALIAVAQTPSEQTTNEQTPNAQKPSVSTTTEQTTNAQTPSDNREWQPVLQLPVGGNVRIETKDGKKQTGRLVAVTDEDIKLGDGQNLTTWQRGELKKVWQLREPNRTKQRIFSGLGTAAGTVAGLAVAVGLGFRQCGRSCDDERAGAYTAVIGLPVAGGVLGYQLAGLGKATLIYQAP